MPSVPAPLRPPVVPALLAIALVAACAPAGEGHSVPVDAAVNPVIYGEDDRTDVHAHPDAFWRELAVGSVVALVNASRIVADDPEDIRFRASTLGRNRNLCEGERFADQPAVSFCSGTLIGDDLVLTAGHCVDGADSCATTRFVFNYYMASEDERATVTAEDVFECAEILSVRNDGAQDHAVVRLDRPAGPERVVAPFRAEDEALALGHPVGVIGFPSGLPMKIDLGGIVTRNREDRLDYFEASLDTFGGNSGSGVFDMDGVIVGILVRGARDYVEDGDCTRVNVLPEGAPGRSGEGVTYVARAIEALCADGMVDDPVCGGLRRRWCAPCAESAECDVTDGEGEVVEDGVCAIGEDGGMGLCAPPCGEDEDCRADHACIGGRCEPVVGARCRAGELWEVDACGRALALVEACAEDTLCIDDACVARGPNATCDDAFELPAVTADYEGEVLPESGNDSEGSCGGLGPERVLRFTVEERSWFRAMSRGFDTVLYLRTDCADASTEVFCNDDARPPGRLGSRIEGDLDPGTYYLFLDSYNDNVDSFRLEMVFEPLCARCEPGTSVCDEEGMVVRCTGDPECPVEEVEECPFAEECADGACVPSACVDLCEEGEIRCLEAPAREICREGELGCTVWEPHTDCGAGQRCDEEDGRCRAAGPSSSEPEETGGTTEAPASGSASGSEGLDGTEDVEQNGAAGSSGCAASGAGTPAPGWFLLPGILLGFRRRRSP
ncbi:MAG: serine protease [Deltaproteobacteria bacterium]|nr:MAG: serine protease [Deltaproteobacteria bacterium]